MLRQGIEETDTELPKHFSFRMVKLNFYPIEATSCIYWKIQIRKRRLEICWQMSRYSSPLNGGLRREMKCFKCVITWQRFIFRRFLYTCIWFFFDEKTSLYSCSSIIKRNPIITFCCVRKFTFCQFYGKTYFSYRKIEYAMRNILWLLYDVDGVLVKYSGYTGGRVGARD